MKNKLFLGILPLFFCFFVKAQESEILINDKKDVLVFFESNITKAKTGYSNYVVGYENASNSRVCILKSKGPSNTESNLTVYTEDGNIFSLPLKYSKDITKTSYAIPSSLSKGNLKNNENKKSDEKKDTLKKQVERKSEKITHISNINLIQSNLPEIKHYSEQSENIILRLINIVYKNEYLYFVLELENASTLDYDINYISYYIKSRKASRKSSSQKFNLSRSNLRFQYNYKERISVSESNRFIVVFNKFSIDKKKSLEIELNESNGERNIKLHIDSSLINNPYIF